MITVTIWILFGIATQGEMRHIHDYKTADACQKSASEAATKGIALRCMETTQIVPQKFYDSLR